MTKGTLILQDGSKYEGISFGAEKNTSGELVFSTGMVGYPESLTDPSFEGQILIFTYPMIGNYGVPPQEIWESIRIHTKGIIVSHYIDTPSHFQSVRTLSQWLQAEGIPALEIKDTRHLAQKLRDNGAQLGKLYNNNTDRSPIDWYDPNSDNLVAQVSIKKPLILTPKIPSKKTLILIDCGAKKTIEDCLLKRGVTVKKVPWDFDPFSAHNTELFDGLLISNGPGDPKKATKTIATIKKALENKIPTLGICLGNQLLALAGGGNTNKLKFGHRSQNQPCQLVGTNSCYITTQNHGFHVNDIPHNFKPWFINANDQSNEGIIHESLPFMSVQFHPEATPGPVDTEWIFDYFLEKIDQ